jgi:hypothetical protein
MHVKTAIERQRYKKQINYTQDSSFMYNPTYLFSETMGIHPDFSFLRRVYKVLLSLINPKAQVSELLKVVAKGKEDSRLKKGKLI